MEIAESESFIFLNCGVKPSMKKNYYKVILKFSYHLADVCAVACTCPAGTGTNFMGRCNHIGAILFLMEDFNWKGIEIIS